MTTLNLVSFIANIATFITAILIYLTLQEMIRQRKGAIKPEIVPINQDIYAGKDPIAATSCPTFWLKEHLHKFEEGSIPLPLNYTVTLYNLGNGAAKEVFLKWEFKIHDFLEKINKMSQMIFAEHYAEILKDNSLEFRSKNGAVGSVNLDLDLKEKLDYLLPSSVEKTGAEIRLPFSYKNLVLMWFN